MSDSYNTYYNNNSIEKKTIKGREFKFRII